MKKLLCFLFYLTTSISLFSQEVIASQGNSYANANGSIDFTMGEVVIATISTVSNALTQGFHQTKLGVLAVEDFDLIYQAQAYPNPTPDLLNLEIQLFEGLKYEIYDMQGRQLGFSSIENRFTEVSFKQFAIGLYMLVVLNENNQKLKTYRIIKN